MSIYKKLKTSGLTGCLNDTGITSENYKKYISGTKPISQKEDLTKAPPSNWQAFVQALVGCIGKDKALKVFEYYNELLEECEFLGIVPVCLPYEPIEEDKKMKTEMLIRNIDKNIEKYNKANDIQKK